MQVIFPRGDFSMWSRAVTMKGLVNVRCHLSFIVLPITSSARPCDHLTTSCVCDICMHRYKHVHKYMGGHVGAGRYK